MARRFKLSDRAKAKSHRPELERMESRQLLAPMTFVVTRTDDTEGPTGTLNLREAIVAANANVDPSPDMIVFNLPGTGVQTITPSFPLPEIIDPVIIDAYSQPGASPNTQTIGDNAVLQVRLDGAAAGANVDGLVITAGNSTVRGLIVTGFQGPAQGATIGSGIVLKGSGGNLVQGNFLGTDPTGSIGRGNGLYGVAVTDSSNNTIGGTSPADRNVISANGADGVFLASRSGDVPVTGNVVLGNFLGTDRTGAAALGNGGAGVSLLNGAANNTIGGTIAGAGNVIAFNRSSGVVVIGNASTGNAILSNLFFANGARGIDLGGDGATPNTPGGPRVGPNNLQNTPVLAPVTRGATSTTIGFSLDSTPLTTFTVQFFSVLAAGQGGAVDQGRFFLGQTSVTTNGSGQASGSFLVNGPIPGVGITATATDPGGNTSEFAASSTLLDPVVTPPPPTDGPRFAELVVSQTGQPDPVFVDEELTYSISLVNQGNISATNAIVTDVLPQGTELVRFVANPSDVASVVPPFDPAATSVQFVIPTIGPGQSASYVVVVRPRFAGLLLNSVSITAKGAPPDVTGNVANLTTQALFNFSILNTNDAGFGSLRSAIDQANRNPGPETIRFTLPAGSPLVISPRTALPILTGPTILDATSQPGFAGTPIVVLSGASLSVSNATFPSEPGAGSNGLNLGSGVTVRGLIVRDFPGNGIAILGGSNNLIAGNVIRDNGDSGIFIRSVGDRDQSGGEARDNRIGGLNLADRNVIANNQFVGIQVIQHATGTLIQGNLIGSDATGERPDGNGLDGIFLSNAIDTTIGGTVAGARNLISNSGEVNIQVFGPDAVRNVIQGNIIGPDLSGQRALFGPDSNIRTRANVGVFLNGVSNNLVGGNTPEAVNLISGNDVGVEILGPGATGNRVIGNLIGTNLAGTGPIPNQYGIFLSGAPGNTIGGTTPGERNVISGNEQIGLRISGLSARGNLIQGNFIGTDVSGRSALGNDQDGIFVDRAPANTIGGRNVSERNIISANRLVDIQIFGSEAEGNVVAGNFIGTNLDGQPIPDSRFGPGSAFVGVFLNNAPRNNIGLSEQGAVGGSAPAAGNLIANHRQAGIEVIGPASVGNIIVNNTIRNSVDFGIIADNVGDNTIPLSGPGANTIVGSTVSFQQVATFGPAVQDIQTTGDGANLQSVVVAFSRPLREANAEDLRNYRIDILDARGRRIGRVSIASAVYDPVALTVTLTPTQPLAAAGHYRITILATRRSGILDELGRRLDGNLDGMPGDNFVSRFGAGVAPKVSRPRGRARAVQARRLMGSRPWHKS